MKYKAIVTDYVWPNLDIERSILNENEIDLVDCKSMSREDILSESADADAIIFCFADGIIFSSSLFFLFYYHIF